MEEGSNASKGRAPPVAQVAGSGGCNDDTMLGSNDEEALWPALQNSSTPLRSLLNSDRSSPGKPKKAAANFPKQSPEGLSIADDALQRDRGTATCIKEEEIQRLSERDRLRGESSTDRVNGVVGAAFDRLWRDRPVNPSEAMGASQGGAGNSEAQVLCNVDNYISHYFRHVAELSRESVYQSHQREILQRMREDLVNGDRSGSMRELDEMIQKADLDDKSLQAEIHNLMRIADANEGGVLLNCCPRATAGADNDGRCFPAARCAPSQELGACAGCCVSAPLASEVGGSKSSNGAVNNYVFSAARGASAGGAASGGASDETEKPLFPGAANPGVSGGGSSSADTSGKAVPTCRPCNLQ